MPNLDRSRQVIVEGEQIDASSSDPIGNLGLGVEVIDLLAKMQPVVNKRLVLESLESREESARGLGATKARLP